MDTRMRAVWGVVLVVAGAALWVFVVRPLLGPPQGEWAAQMAADATPLTQLVRYDLQIENTGEIDAAWEKRKALYDAKHLEQLRDKLTAFVEFQVAEYADAKDVYLSGRDPERPSTQVVLAHARLKEAFGATADTMIAQYKERVRDAAYKASPAVAGGIDPDLPRYDAEYDRLVTDWLPRVKATIERLTAASR